MNEKNLNKLTNLKIKRDKLKSELININSQISKLSTQIKTEIVNNFINKNEDKINNLLDENTKKILKELEK